MSETAIMNILGGLIWAGIFGWVTYEVMKRGRKW